MSQYYANTIYGLSRQGKEMFPCFLDNPVNGASFGGKRLLRPG